MLFQLSLPCLKLQEIKIKFFLDKFNLILIKCHFFIERTVFRLELHYQWENLHFKHSNCQDISINGDQEGP